MTSVSLDTLFVFTISKLKKTKWIYSEVSQKDQV